MAGAGAVVAEINTVGKGGDGGGAAVHRKIFGAGVGGPVDDADAAAGDCVGAAGGEAEQVERRDELQLVVVQTRRVAVAVQDVDAAQEAEHVTDLVGGNADEVHLPGGD